MSIRQFAEKPRESNVLIGPALEASTDIHPDILS